MLSLNGDVEQISRDWIEDSKRMREQYADWFVSVPEGKSGDWAVEKIKTPDEPDLEILRSIREGRPVYRGEYTRLCDRYYTVMSDTIAEIKDHKVFTRRVEILGHNGEPGPNGGVFIQKDILINGLGLGMVLNYLLKRNLVRHVDVVELNEDVIKLVGPTYSSDPRVTIHHADALTIKWPRGTRWDFAWHDIWPGICPDNLADMKKLHAKYRNRVRVFQGAWCQMECLRAKKRWG